MPRGAARSGRRRQERVLPFERGKAMLCLFTDGLADARGPNGERDSASSAC